MDHHERLERIKIIRLKSTIILNGLKRLIEDADMMQDVLNSLEKGFDKEMNPSDALALVTQARKASKGMSKLFKDLEECLPCGDAATDSTGTKE
ncbi:MAG: hypothetical protein ACRDBQ_18885 [Shewanella sp.]